MPQDFFPANWFRSCRNTYRAVIYVPAIHEQRKCWGESSGYREELINRRIVEAYRNGISMEELADRYHLSIYAIRKIIYQK